MFSTRIKFIIDFLAFFFATIVALWLRLDLNIYTVINRYQEALFWGTVVHCILGLFFIFYYQTYRQIWRYTSFREIVQLIKLLFLESAFFVAGIFLFFRGTFPRSVFLLSPIIIFGIMLIPRFVIGYYSERSIRIFKKDTKKALIVGAGDAGEKIYREINRHIELGYRVVGFVDDDARKINSHLHGIRVLGKIDKLPEIIRKKNIDTVVVAIPSAGRKIIQRVYDLVSPLKIETLVMPGIYELIGKKISFNILRPFKMEDLLSRDPVFFDMQKVAASFSGKRILITGACGSIGSEISRQLAISGIELILLDNNETGIFDLNNELISLTQVHPLVADIRYLGRLRNIVETYQPNYIFHAAAYKHVPLMEENHEEAFLVNVVGTLNCIEAMGGGVEKLVVISTDKAVEPENMMGMSKKMAEILVSSAAKNFSTTRMVVVRFGNVLGSRGNVLEVWKNQLQKNQPLTITDPAMKRYFMTTQEAVTLVLEASLL
ncbi:MAG: polysaccharide biosynthesis protein, partial [Candidatus Atribacteria bacterium]|nr:polysaccharide biosynthesis protein [Candidatus Atribacteria bacterium]